MHKEKLNSKEISRILQLDFKDTVSSEDEKLIKKATQYFLNTTLFADIESLVYKHNAGQEANFVMREEGYLPEERSSKPTINAFGRAKRNRPFSPINSTQASPGDILYERPVHITHALKPNNSPQSEETSLYNAFAHLIETMKKQYTELSTELQRYYNALHTISFVVGGSNIAFGADRAKKYYYYEDNDTQSSPREVSISDMKNLPKDTVVYSKFVHENNNTSFLDNFMFSEYGVKYGINIQGVAYFKEGDLEEARLLAKQIDSERASLIQQEYENGTFKGLLSKDEVVKLINAPIPIFETTPQQKRFKLKDTYTPNHNLIELANNAVASSSNIVEPKSTSLVKQKKGDLSRSTQFAASSEASSNVTEYASRSHRSINSESTASSRVKIDRMFDNTKATTNSAGVSLSQATPAIKKYGNTAVTKKTR